MTWVFGNDCVRVSGSNIYYECPVCGLTHFETPQKVIDHLHNHTTAEIRNISLK